MRPPTFAGSSITTHGGDAKVHGRMLPVAWFELAELLLGASQADLETLELAEPAFRLGFGDSSDQVVADLGKPCPLARVRSEERASDTARKGQAGTKERERTSGSRASAASLATDLELARAELAVVREERGRLKDAVQRHLGQQLHQTGAKDLAARINELQATNKDLEIRLAEAEADRRGLPDALQEAQDDLIAAREALRNMMRDTNRPS